MKVIKWSVLVLGLANLVACAASSRAPVHIAFSPVEVFRGEKWDGEAPKKSEVGVPFHHELGRVQKDGTLSIGVRPIPLAQLEAYIEDTAFRENWPADRKRQSLARVRSAKDKQTCFYIFTSAVDREVVDLKYFHPYLATDNSPNYLKIVSTEPARSSGSVGWVNTTTYTTTYTPYGSYVQSRPSGYISDTRSASHSGVFCVDQVLDFSGAVVIHVERRNTDPARVLRFAWSDNEVALAPVWFEYQDEVQAGKNQVRESRSSRKR